MARLLLPEEGSVVSVAKLVFRSKSHIRNLDLDLDIDLDLDVELTVPI